MASRRPEVTNDPRRFDEIVMAREQATPAPPPRLAFGGFVLDPESGRLLEGERVIPLAPKPFETLFYLASRPGRVVAKTELMEKVWPGTFVTDDVLVQCVVEIRRALGDPAKHPQYVQTIPRRGYQFLTPVRRFEPGLGGSPIEVHPSTTAREIASTDVVPTRTRGERRLLAVSVVVLLLAGGLYAWFRAGRPGLATPGLLESGSLVVMPVAVEEPMPQSGWLRHGLAEMIGAQLGQAPGIHIVARHRLAAALAAAGYADERGPTPETAVLIARRLGAERLVTGTFVRIEDRFVLNAQVVEVGSGRTAGTAQARGVHPSGVLDAVNELCLKLLSDLGPSESHDAAFRPTRMPTDSIEAYRHYVEALTAYARGGRRGAEEAEKALDEALRLDPRFALAHLKKAEIQQYRREWGFGDPDPAPAVQAAARLAKDLPDRERLVVESFEAWIVRDDAAVALKDWSALLQFYPTYAQEIGVPGLVAAAFERQGRWDDLILVGEAHVDSPSMPDSGRARVSSSLAQAFRRKGEFERALEYARRAVRLWPSREGPRFLRERIILGRMSLEAGRRSDALAEFRAASKAGEADVVTLTDAAWGVYMAGEAEEASTLVGRALAQEAGYGNAYHLKGWLELARKGYAAAARSFETAFERTPRAFGSPHQGLVGADLGALYYSGVADQKAGQQRRASATLRGLMDRCRKILAHRSAEPGSAPDWQAANYLSRAAARLGLAAPEPPRLTGDDATYYVQSARLHAVQGKREQALKELARGLALGFGEYRHIQDDPDFESLREAAAFKRLVTDRVPQ